MSNKREERERERERDKRSRLDAGTRPVPREVQRKQTSRLQSSKTAETAERGC